MSRIDIRAGDKFGNWIINGDQVSIGKHRMFPCVCKRCGTEKTISVSDLFKCIPCWCISSAKANSAKTNSAKARNKGIASMEERNRDMEEMFLGDVKITLGQVGSAFGLTRERVRKILSLRLGARYDERITGRRIKIKEDEKSKKEVRRYRRKIYLDMIFMARKQRLRHDAGIDALGLCRGHYHMPGNNTMCRFRGCNKTVDARGFCIGHYGALRESGALWVSRRSRSICIVDECTRPVCSRNMCRLHYNRYLKKSDKHAREKIKTNTGEKNVYLDKRTGRYYITIQKGEETVYGGSFFRLCDAVSRRDEIRSDINTMGGTNGLPSHIPPSQTMNDTMLPPRSSPCMGGMVFCQSCGKEMRSVEILGRDDIWDGYYYVHKCKVTKYSYRISENYIEEYIFPDLWSKITVVARGIGLDIPSLDMDQFRPHERKSIYLDMFLKVYYNKGDIYFESVIDRYKEEKLDIDLEIK